VRNKNIGPYNTSKDDYMRDKTRSSLRFTNKNYNSFSPLLDYDTKCYKCNNYGHIACEFRSGILNSPKKTWKNIFLPNIENNTQGCGKGSKKNQRRKNVDLQCILQTKGENGTLCNTLFPPVCKNNWTGQELWQNHEWEYVM
jgi:hypothetical protein